MYMYIIGRDPCMGKCFSEIIISCLDLIAYLTVDPYYGRSNLRRRHFIEQLVEQSTS